MGHLPEKAEFTNMCMIYDEEGNILVQDRIKSWCGLAFPGGHLELKESIVESVIREVKEETGLDISNLELCGIKQWFNEEKGRNVCFLYKTKNYSGSLKSSSEGRNFWIARCDLINYKLADGFEDMIRVFEEPQITEYYHVKTPSNIVDELK